MSEKTLKFLKKKFQWSTNFCGETTISIVPQPELCTEFKDRRMDTDDEVEIVDSDEYVIEKVKNSIESRKAMAKLSARSGALEELHEESDQDETNDLTTEMRVLAKNLKYLDIIAKNHIMKLRKADLMPKRFFLSGENDEDENVFNSNEVYDNIATLKQIGTCRTCRRQFAVRTQDITKKLRLQCGGSTWLSLDILSLNEDNSFFYCLKCDLAAACPQCEDYDNDYLNYIGRLIFLNRASPTKDVTDNAMANENETEDSMDIEGHDETLSIGPSKNNILSPPECPMKVPLDIPKVYNLGVKKISPAAACENEIEGEASFLSNEISPILTKNTVQEKRNDSSSEQSKISTVNDPIFKIPNPPKLNQHKEKMIRIILEDCNKGKPNNIVNENLKNQNGEDVVIIKEIFHDKFKPQHKCPTTNNSQSPDILSSGAHARENNDGELVFDSLNGEHELISRDNVVSKRNPFKQNKKNSAVQRSQLIRNKICIEMMKGKSKMNTTEEKCCSSYAPKTTTTMFPRAFLSACFSKNSAMQHKLQKHQPRFSILQKNRIVNSGKKSANISKMTIIKDQSTTTKMAKQGSFENKETLPENITEFTKSQNPLLTGVVESAEQIISVKSENEEDAKSLQEKTQNCTNVDASDSCKDSKEEGVEKINSKEIPRPTRPASTPAIWTPSEPKFGKELFMKRLSHRKSPKPGFSVTKLSRKQTFNVNSMSDLIFASGFQNMGVFKKIDSLSDIRNKYAFKSVASQTEEISSVIPNDQFSGIQNFRRQNIKDELHEEHEKENERSNPSDDIEESNAGYVQQNNTENNTNDDSSINSMAGTNIEILKKLAEGYSLQEIAEIKKRVEIEMKHTIDAQFQATCEDLFGKHQHYDLENLSSSPLSNISNSPEESSNVIGNPSYENPRSEFEPRTMENQERERSNLEKSFGYWYIATAPRTAVTIKNPPINNALAQHILLNVRQAANEGNTNSRDSSPSPSSLPVISSKFQFTNGEKIQNSPQSQNLISSQFSPTAANANIQNQHQSEVLAENFLNANTGKYSKPKKQTSDTSSLPTSPLQKSPTELQQSEGLFRNPLTLSADVSTLNDSHLDKNLSSPSVSTLQGMQCNFSQRITPELFQRNNSLEFQDLLHRQYALGTILDQKKSKRGNSGDCPCTMCISASAPFKKKKRPSPPQNYPGQEGVATSLRILEQDNIKAPNYQINQHPRFLDRQNSALSQELLQNRKIPPVVPQKSSPGVPSAFQKQSLVLNPSYESVRCSNPFEESSENHARKMREESLIQLSRDKQLKTKQKTQQSQRSIFPLTLNTLWAGAQQFQNKFPPYYPLPQIQPSDNGPRFFPGIPPEFAYLPESLAKLYQAELQKFINAQPKLQ